MKFQFATQEEYNKTKEYLDSNKFVYKEIKTKKQKDEEKKLRADKRTPEENEKLKLRIQKMQDAKRKKKEATLLANPTKDVESKPAHVKGRREKKF